MNETEVPAEIGFFDFNLFGWPWTGLVTLLTLTVYFVLTYNVGRARKRFGIMPPDMTGPEDFMRVVRVHGNTVEQMLMFLPLLWMAAFAARDEIAAAIGVFWPLSRILYAAGYYKSVKGRVPGFLSGLLIVVILFILCAVQMVRSILTWPS